jgi:hypothetical protein
MGIATHLGPWLLGTVKDKTGNTSGTARNLGATVVAQTKAIAFGDAAGTTAFALPAGSLILNIQVATTTGFSSGTTIVFSGNGTQITQAVAITNLGYTLPITMSATAGSSAYITNTGTAPTFVTYTITGTSLSSGNATAYIEYIVRNTDGTI